jgi:hypothetical protein
MNNKKAIETFNILSQLDNEKNLPIKFDYGLAKIITSLEPIVKDLQKLTNKKVEGQKEYETEKNHIFEEMAEKDENGKPKHKQVKNGIEYKIKDLVALNTKLNELADKYSDTVNNMRERIQDYNNLLDQEIEDFKPYKINIKYLPVTEEGKCQISPLQIRYLFPFLEGDINDIPDN